LSLTLPAIGVGQSVAGNLRPVTVVLQQAERFSLFLFKELAPTYP